MKALNVIRMFQGAQVKVNLLLFLRKLNNTNNKLEKPILLAPKLWLQCFISI
ncbi:hypothetical protein [Proteus mirabilis]|uniref:hypothetical protein n=1 Tax=Proteus mirabilis TaxID=584 RepID=UPI0013DE3D53|nr:hypothetical protein [Proteus mirabilis]